MAANNFFDILERRDQRGYFPLNENHWSNVLAWILTSQHNETLSRSLLELLSPAWNPSTWAVDREVSYVVGDCNRLIDIQLTANDDERLFIEVKIAPDNQIRPQIVDQLRLLRPNEFFVLLSPLDLSNLLSDAESVSGSEVSTTAMTWRRIGDWCEQQLADTDDLAPLERAVLDGINQYWNNPITLPFEHMAQVILDEQGWVRFYPDDFKAAFLERFPDVWAAWVANKPESGNGNPHQYLVTCLSMLANRKNGFRLVRTGQSRSPKPSDWGYPTIYELSVPTDASSEGSE